MLSRTRPRSTDRHVELMPVVSQWLCVDMEREVVVQAAALFPSCVARDD